MQRMYRARLILRLLVFRLGRRGCGFLPMRTLHPWRRARGQIVFGLGGRLIVLNRLALLGAGLRLSLYIGPAHRKRIGLADQPGQFGQRIALAPASGVLIAAATIVIVVGIRSVLISISHRGDASPSARSQFVRHQIVRQMIGHPPVAARIPMRATFNP
jgi:hypothetical protein